MKLIYARGACSLAVHIMLEELGFKYEAVRVSLEDKTVLEQYNEKSYVPVLILPSGEKLTEAIAILQYLGDHYEREDLFPAQGTLERARCIEWLVFLSTEIHKGMGPLFHRKDLTQNFEKMTLKKLEQRFGLIDWQLTKNKFLLEQQYTIADMYCLALLRIAEHVKVNLNKFPNIMTYKLMLEEMPLVTKIIDEEDHADVALKAA